MNEALCELVRHCFSQATVFVGLSNVAVVPQEASLCPTCSITVVSQQTADLKFNFFPNLQESCPYFKNFLSVLPK